MALKHIHRSNKRQAAVSVHLVTRLIFPTINVHTMDDDTYSRSVSIYSSIQRPIYKKGGLFQMALADMNSGDPVRSHSAHLAANARLFHKTKLVTSHVAAS